MGSKRSRIPMHAVLSAAAELLGVDADAADGTDPVTRRLVLCANCVADDLSARVPLEAFEQTRADKNGFVPFTALSSPVRSVLGVWEHGLPTPFRVRADGIECKPNAAVGIAYAAAPARVGVEGVLTLDARIGPSVVCFGVCAAFCAAEGLADRAREWQARFDEALARIPPRSGRTLPKRGLV